ncbi:hypothetical protein LCGC14_0678370 [marine sediment metagenome]|uniref:Uncharacterized protein n=1 Tax=marine sediment metagenome TaxID=412755 RepID=A0A0F9QNY4_9ZZZZ
MGFIVPPMSLAEVVDEILHRANPHNAGRADDQFRGHVATPLIAS